MKKRKNLKYFLIGLASVLCLFVILYILFTTEFSKQYSIPTLLFIIFLLIVSFIVKVKDTEITDPDYKRRIENAELPARARFNASLYDTDIGTGAVIAALENLNKGN